MALTDKLTAVADAIRGKTGKPDRLTLDEMPQAIAGIEGGGGVKYTVGTLVPVTIENWDADGEGHTKTVTLTGYNPGPNGIQIGMPDGCSTANEQALLKAALTVPSVTSSAPKKYAGKTTLTFSAVNVPEGSLTVGVFGLEECEPVTVPTDTIYGVTPPATGEKPVTTCYNSYAHGGTVKWSPAVKSGGFASGEVYTATITLTADRGYKLEGVTENFFKVLGAPDGTVVTNPADSGVVTAVFPATT